MTDYLKKSFVTYLNQIIRLALIAASNVLIARFLGPSGKGILTLLMNFLLVTVMLGMFGLDEANVYFISSKKGRYQNILGNALYQILIISVICIVVFIGFDSWFLSRPLKGIDINYYYLMIILVPFIFFNQHVRTILLGHRAIYRFNVFMIGQFLLLLIFQVVFIPLFDLSGGVYAIILATICLSVVGFIFIARFGSPRRTPDYPLLKKCYGYGIKSQLGIVFSYLNRRLDVFIVNFFLDPYQVGLYAIAVAVGELPWHLPAAAATVLFPWIADKKRKDAAQFTSYVTRNVLFLTIIAALILFFVGRFLITVLFGDQFAESVVLMYVLLPGIIALGITRLMGSHFQGSGRPELGTIMVAFSFIETIVLDILLIPRMGALGASIASSIAYITSGIIGIVLFSRLWHIRIVDIIIPRWHELKKIGEFVKIMKKKGQ
jgi:O-antigen/teichoic acid export membrane protein